MKRAQSVALRMEAISRQFLGRPYITNPLIGSAETPEVFTSAENGFDCVTYIETVLARAHARDTKNFTENLQRIRYDNGRVEWKRRNHYMTNWIRNNARDGLLRQVDFGNAAITKRRRLNMVPGLPAQSQRFSCIPKRLLPKVDDRIHSGDLIFFASTRPQLDVFHCGIVIRDGERLLLRHASRSQGGVVEQELSTFLKANRMAGVILARPVDSPETAAKGTR
ncbi:MAG TPA: N-acetylmuramoyl-L-alanine amidase-like domain-containing protein [Terriglobia bacterium]|nr:N-acetylmuramoyl-L-alanine amidase-like domain-containing protein [Terriglobia bacterium]